MAAIFKSAGTTGGRTVLFDTPFSSSPSSGAVFGIRRSDRGARSERQGQSQLPRGYRGVLGRHTFAHLRGRGRRAGRLAARVRRGAVLDRAPGADAGRETRGPPRGWCVMAMALRPSFEGDRLEAENLGGSRAGRGPALPLGGRAQGELAGARGGEAGGGVAWTMLSRRKRISFVAHGGLTTRLTSSMYSWLPAPPL